MKKLILTTIILIVAVAGALAQSTADVAVTATVNDALTLTPTAVAFGSIQAGQASYIQANANDGTTETNLGSTHSAGALQIQGTTGVDVTVSWTNATLTDASNANPITFTPTVYLGAAQISSGASNVTLAGGNITLDVGGALGSIANPGVYSTTTDGGSPAGDETPVVFTVSYTSV
tara:strand:- start:51854 stop:52381 length:528 start_codon:yes stop_codon:yes gene_type:complete